MSASAAIGILMNCMISTADIPVALTTNQPFIGTCTGLYQDKQTHKTMGAWSMELRFTPQQNGERLVTTRLRGGAVVPAMEGEPNYEDALKELEEETMRFAAKEVLRTKQNNIATHSAGPGI